MLSTLNLCALSFYRAAPQQRVSLGDFEELGHDRLKLLSQIQTRRSLHATYRAAEPFVDMALPQLLPDSDADRLSHYALRLAFCRVSSNWDWLVTAEVKLLAVRLEELPPYAAVALLSSEGIKYELLNAEGLKLDVTQHGFYRVPFTEVPTLVRSRDVVIADGFCFVPLRKMKAVALHRFRKSLQEQMRDLQCTMPAQPLELARLTPILDAFVAKAHVLNGAASALTTTARKLEAATIDEAADKHFPLCMKQLHRKLREHHHLKYDGRVQYRMFLKGAGFSVHECNQFFRSEFTKKIPAAKFDKEYAYHIRHSYGLEGARKDYAPLDCEQTIAGSAPGHGQYHGCPFKHWSPSALQTELRRGGLSLHTSMEITQQASAGHYQRACRALFDETHPSSAEYTTKTMHKDHNGQESNNAVLEGTSRTNIMRHPNEYLAASMATHAGNEMATY